MDVQVTSTSGGGGGGMSASATRSTSLTTEEAVHIRGLTAGYVADQPVLRDVSLTVPRRGVTRLGGRNGVGKSTLVEVLSGFLPPLDGEVRVLGRDAGNDDLRGPRRVVRTRPALYPFMTVRDHLAVACRARGADRSMTEERAVRLGLEPWLDENASTLSSGTAKKAWHVLSTVGEAELFILDEPFNAVDEAGVEAMVEEVHGWARSAAVLVVCHTVPPALRVDQECDLT
jgi:ABC-type multidrug transport system ATPase subunit